MEKQSLILAFAATLALIVQSCNLPIQYVGFEDQQQEGFPPEDRPQEEHPPEDMQPGENPPEERPPENFGEVQIVFFTANRTNIQSGECAILEWSVQGSSWITLNEERVESAGLREVCPAETTSYRLAADAGTEILEREITIIVEGSGQPQPQQQPQTQPQPTQPQAQSGCAGSPVITSFSATPTTITAGQSATLSWGKVTNGANGTFVNSVVLDPGFGEVGSPGSRVVNPSTTTTYTLKGTGCGGTITKQVTVVVNSGSSVQSGVDLALTDLFSQSLPKGDVYARVTNHGPASLSNAKVDLKCTVDKTDYSTGVKTSVAKSYPASITLDLKPGQTKSFSTNITVDTSAHWYQFDCNVQVQNSNDPKTGNNSYSETFPPPP
ncbi:MAG: hypothetical protein MUO77_10660 [Anaerolineales bacterium]|nr:hypothetical protein [Anaerolineales bacterium]